VKFETFSSLVPELENFGRHTLERESFDKDIWFHKKDTERVEEPAAHRDMRPANRISPTDVLERHMQKIAVDSKEQGSELTHAAATGGAYGAIRSIAG
jgi:hypothetical protein